MPSEDLYQWPSEWRSSSHRGGAPFFCAVDLRPQDLLPSAVVHQLRQEGFNVFEEATVEATVRAEGIWQNANEGAWGWTSPSSMRPSGSSSRPVINRVFDDAQDVGFIPLNAGVRIRF